MNKEVTVTLTLNEVLTIWGCMPGPDQTNHPAEVQSVIDKMRKILNENRVAGKSDIFSF